MLILPRRARRWSRARFSGYSLQGIERIRRHTVQKQDGKSGSAFICMLLGPDRGINCTLIWKKLKIKQIYSGMYRYQLLTFFKKFFSC